VALAARLRRIFDAIYPIGLDSQLMRGRSVCTLFIAAIE
jgi:hypothetical protein